MSKPIHVFQFWQGPGELPEPYATCTRRAAACPWIDSYTLVRFDPLPGVAVYNLADLRKLELARREPWALILDADAYLDRRPEFDLDDAPYFDQLPDVSISERSRARVARRPGAGGLLPEKSSRPHGSGYYVNGCLEWFRALRLPEVPPPVRGWTNKLLAEHRPCPYPMKGIVHLYANVGKIRLPKQDPAWEQKPPDPGSTALVKTEAEG